MKRQFLLILSLLQIMIGYSQRVAKVSATYTYYAPETMSVEEAKRVALDRAKIQAIADEFGTIVSQSTSTIVSNINGETDSHFFSVGGSDVKGEWIETIGEPVYNISFAEHHLVIKCDVKGKIKETTPSKLHFETTFLRNGQTIPSSNIEYSNGDEMSMQFQSSTNGFLILFFLVRNADVAYRILPYRQDSNTLQQIKANIQYTFFSKVNNNDSKNTEYIDEFILTCDDKVERDAIYAIFSDNEYSVPNLKYDSNGLLYLNLQSFKDWLARVKRTSNDTLIKTYELKITN